MNLSVIEAISPSADPAQRALSLGARGPRWFSPDSFWNQPLRADAAIHAESRRWTALLAEAHASRQGAGLHINVFNWTLPVYVATPATPRRLVRPKLLQCPYSQGHVVASLPYLHPDHVMGIHPTVRDGIPIPDDAAPDAEADAHLVVVAPHENRIYDLWQCRRDADGNWSSNAAIAYPLDGPGVLHPADIAGIRDGESVHFYGPCRACGVPASAGLIRLDEIRAGRIDHKLAFACQVAALREHVFPAIWTDGWLPGGLPEGIVLQLDPALDLSRFKLAPAARVIARALQEYGAALVDNAGGVTLYTEWLGHEGASAWDGLLAEDSLFGIPFAHFRVLKPEHPVVVAGSHPIYHHGMSGQFYGYLRDTGHVAEDFLPTFAARNASGLGTGWPVSATPGPTANSL